MTVFNPQYPRCPLCNASESKALGHIGEQRETAYYVCQKMICNACGHVWLTDWLEDDRSAYVVEDQIQRDFDHEQETGICSYCGDQLEVVEAPDGTLIFNSCAACNAYNDELTAEEFYYDEPNDGEAASYGLKANPPDFLGDIPF